MAVAAIPFENKVIYTLGVCNYSKENTPVTFFEKVFADMKEDWRKERGIRK